MLRAAICQILFRHSTLEGIRQSLTMSNFPDIRYCIRKPENSITVIKAFNFI